VILDVYHIFYWYQSHMSSMLWDSAAPRGVLHFVVQSVAMPSKPSKRDNDELNSQRPEKRTVGGLEEYLVVELCSNPICVDKC
jgi:hypothetical protein